MLASCPLEVLTLLGRMGGGVGIIGLGQAPQLSDKPGRREVQ